MISQAQSVEQLLAAARTRDPPDLEAFLDEVCKDSPGLRQILRSRLSADEGDELTLDQSISSAESRSRGATSMSPQGHFCPGQLIAQRFTVIRYIARGGMGEVYEVEDNFLQGVRVALKVILPEIAENAGSSQRFEQEVLLARKVVHPNLCPIYDIARCSDPPPPYMFLTMKLLAGETLSARLRRQDPVPREEKIAIFRQLMAGLSHIHAAGIIHRDIKPNNVMLDYSGPEVCVSIMDFGLARLHDPDTTMPANSLIAGTPGYMAPEVLNGQGPSQAADLFALGVLLHELATGKRPDFSTLTDRSKASSPLSEADVPPFYIRAVCAFLSSDPQRRCKMAESIGSELELNYSLQTKRSRTKLRVLATVVCLLVLLVSLLLVPAVGERARGVLFASREKHIVVLPFELVGNTPEIQALGDGLMDSLAGKLANLDSANRSLWVVPTSEVRSQRVSNASAAMHTFGATLVVEGRFERENDVAHLRLTLIDPKKLRDIGFVDVQNQTGDMSALQDQAVTRLGRLMNISVRADPSVKADAPISHGAYEDYLIALGYAQRLDRPGNLDRAIESLQRALLTDPTFTLGAARLAQVYVMKFRMDKDPALLDDAKRYAEQALASDARVPLAHVALGQVEQYTGHHDLAAQEFQRAVDLNPKDPEALTGLASSVRDLGRNSEAEAIFIRAANLRPDDWNGYNNLGLFYKRVGRTADAIRQIKRAIELSPDNSGLYANLGSFYLDTGDPSMLPEAERAFNKSIALSPNYKAYANLGIAFSAEHRFTDSINANRRALAFNSQDYQVWSNLAECYEWLGDERGAQDARRRARELLVPLVKLDSQNAEAQATLALLDARDKLSAEATARIQIALALEPSDHSILWTIADTYESLGERRLAIQYLHKALANGMAPAYLKTDPYLRDVLTDPHFRGPKVPPAG